MKEKKSELYIRDAQKKDFDCLYEIYMNKEVNPYLTIEIMRKEEFRPIFEELFHTGEMLVFEDQGRVVGTCRLKNLTQRCHHVLQIMTFAVHPAHHGKKYGTRLMECILRDVKENRKHIKRLELVVVTDHPYGMKFYMKFGFKIEGTLKKWMKRNHQEDYTDLYMMALLLEPSF